MLQHGHNPMREVKCKRDTRMYVHAYRSIYNHTCIYGMCVYNNLTENRLCASKSPRRVHKASTKQIKRSELARIHRDVLCVMH